MKKFGLVTVLLVISATFAFAADPEGTVTAVTAATSQDASINLTGFVAQKLSIVVPTSFNIGELGETGETNVTYGYGVGIKIGNATIKSNIKSWTVSLESTNGGLYTTQGTDPNVLTQTIGYTFAIAGIGSKDILPTAKTAIFTMYRKTVGVENFPITLTYNATAIDGTVSANWLSGAYTDTMKVSVAAN